MMGGEHVAGKDIAIDLGTSTIKIYMEGKGIVLNEPAVVAVDLINDEIIAIGNEAYAMLGRTSERVSVVQPLCHGVISDYDLIQYTIQSFLKKITDSKVFMPRVVVSVPCEMTEVQRRAVVDSISATGVRKICLIEEPIAAALGAGVNIEQPHGCLVVDIGSGTTDMAVISLSGIAISKTINIAGDVFDEAIIKYVRFKYHLLIGKRTAEDVKIAIGCVYPRTELVKHRIKGRNLITGLPQYADVTSDEMLECLLEPAMKITQEIQRVLQSTPPELMGDILSDGIIVTGASAQIYGFDKLIARKTEIPVRIADNPATCVVEGAGKAIQFIDDMDKKEYGVLNPLSDAY